MRISFAGNGGQVVSETLTTAGNNDQTVGIARAVACFSIHSETLSTEKPQRGLLSLETV
jgi:hypothetical protein